MRLRRSARPHRHERGIGVLDPPAIFQPHPQAQLPARGRPDRLDGRPRAVADAVLTQALAEADAVSDRQAQRPRPVLAVARHDLDVRSGQITLSPQQGTGTAVQLGRVAVAPRHHQHRVRPVPRPCLGPEGQRPRLHGWGAGDELDAAVPGIGKQPRLDLAARHQHRRRPLPGHSLAPYLGQGRVAAEHVVHRAQRARPRHRGELAPVAHQDHTGPARLRR